MYDIGDIKNEHTRYIDLSFYICCKYNDKKNIIIHILKNMDVKFCFASFLIKNLACIFLIL